MVGYTNKAHSAALAPSKRAPQRIGSPSSTDLARIQDNISLPNLHFEIDDYCSDWVYPPDHFDYIHVRRLYGTVGDWPEFYKECYEYEKTPHPSLASFDCIADSMPYSHLAPGAFLEHTETSVTLMSDDDSIPHGSAFQQSNALAIVCGQRFGKPMAIQNRIKGWITEAGFEDVVEEVFKWPLGDWPADPKLKDIGRWNATLWNLGIEGWSLRLLTQTHGWTADEVRRWNKDIRNQITARKSHGYQLV
ncbi:MAG: hypothetical protein OHK93_001305 [Ramalina farinacea]|uniref:Uncharacterized protein n=1 Tax=Ramalina farinacea TaxID=258253 RepID=A0AA43QP99_9LECA|nr:hypothetical protein [Ramalina farinacea]